MEHKRTQDERSSATRAALVAAARPLFATRGFAEVGTPEIAAAAGVTRGALYHHFAGGKLALFEAVFEQVEQEVMGSVGAQLASAGATDPVAELRAGADAWLDACAVGEVQRIILIEAPAALGWERWRELGLQYGMGMVEGVLEAAMTAGAVPPQPVRPLAHVLIAALDEAALYVARAADPVQARAEVGAVVGTLLDGILTQGR